MAADVAIVDRSVAAAPKDYLLPAGQEILLRAVKASFDGASAAVAYLPALQLLAPDGTVMWTAVPSAAVAAAGSADVSWFRGVGVPGVCDCAPSAGVTVETLYVDSTSSSGTLSGVTLDAGVSYVVVVEGTYTQYNHPLDVGTPEPDAMFPGSTVGRVSTEVGIDAETVFANYSPISTFLGHASNFHMSLDGGATYAYITPEGGPYASPVAGHLYRYTVTGQGHVMGFWITDTIYSDDYGKLKVTIQVPSGTGSGSGAGSLVPATSSTNDGDVLATLAGIPAWSAVDGGSA